MKFTLCLLALLIPAGASVIYSAFADGAADNIAGAGGWAGAGLLGLVLAWLLLRHLPAKDAQLKDMIESRDSLARHLADANERTAKELAEHGARTVADMLATFKNEVTEERNRCDRRHDLLITKLDMLWGDVRDLLTRVAPNPAADPHFQQRQSDFNTAVHDAVKTGGKP